MARYIELSKGGRTLVDDADYLFLSRFNWHVTEGYVVRTSAQKYGDKGYGTISMHRVLLNAPKGMQVDHINHDTLDNRRCNLRLATLQQNQHNQKPQTGKTSAYKGVSFRKINSKWRAQIKVNGKRIHLGEYTDEAMAARVYDQAARHFFGEFCWLNLLSKDISTPALVTVIHEEAA